MYRNIHCFWTYVKSISCARGVQAKKGARFCLLLGSYSEFRDLLVWSPPNLACTSCLLAANIQVSMGGRGRALDNVFCERLWRSVKYENIYLNQYDTVPQLKNGLTEYFNFYNHDRPHQSLNYRTPAEEHFVL